MISSTSSSEDKISCPKCIEPIDINIYKSEGSTNGNDLSYIFFRKAIILTLTKINIISYLIFLNFNLFDFL